MSDGRGAVDENKITLSHIAERQLVKDEDSLIFPMEIDVNYYNSLPSSTEKSCRLDQRRRRRYQEIHFSSNFPWIKKATDTQDIFRIFFFFATDDRSLMRRSRDAYK